MRSLDQVGRLYSAVRSPPRNLPQESDGLKWSQLLDRLPLAPPPRSVSLDAIRDMPIDPTPRRAPRKWRATRSQGRIARGSPRVEARRS